MSEMSALTNLEAASAAFDSVAGIFAEAGMSGPAEAGDQAGAGSAAYDIMQTAIDTAAQGQNDVVEAAGPASDAATESTGGLSMSYALEAGEIGPPEGAGSLVQEVLGLVSEITDLVSGIPGAAADDTASRADASQIRQGIRDLEPGIPAPDFSEATEKKSGEEKHGGQTGEKAAADDTASRADAGKAEKPESQALTPEQAKKTPRP